MAALATRQSSADRKFYLPAKPPNPVKVNLEYAYALKNAPYKALKSETCEGREKLISGNRERLLTGLSNRWRIPNSLGGDLLGSSQAVRATSVRWSESVKNHITSENCRKSLPDWKVSYKFRQNDDRPLTTSNLDDLRRSYDQTTTRPVTAPSNWSNSMDYEKPKSYYYDARDALSFFKKRIPCLPKPDIILHSFGYSWKLHRNVIISSNVLSELFNEAILQSERDSLSRPASRLSLNIKQNTQISSKEITISLNVNDSHVSPRTFAIALGHLYTLHFLDVIPKVDVAGVLSAACYLKFNVLIQRLSQLVNQNAYSKNIMDIYEVSVKYCLKDVTEFCINWLKLNLIPKLSNDVSLRRMPPEILESLLKSHWTFTYSEYKVFCTMILWLYLQINQDIQVLPSMSDLKAFYNSFRKDKSIFEVGKIKKYGNLLKSIRLLGITDFENLHDIQSMNVVPSNIMMTILQKHHRSVNSGGDMDVLNEFEQQAVRFGFIIEKPPFYESQVIEMFGFYFDLKAEETDQGGTFTFSIRRLRPLDPSLSILQCERHTVSMRNDRNVFYSITVQYFNQEGRLQLHTTGIRAQRFGLQLEASLGEVTKSLRQLLC
ncbi:DgyrCDS6910 [Dimorphilus gyrociliatus]|uniref:BTB/POZ domain-containing protein 16 n=1 Tax=Dimorphilus gyrociliatus TaxID=2664684 RepID=A0A7I8VQ17_9ANNE|nr:DgyrCDS6910 [Dimorphilus gyrociliatus]